MKALLSAEHASGLYGASRRQFLRVAQELKIAPVKMGRKHFYKRTDVEWMKKQAA